MDLRVLVTGGSGFIGTNLVAHYAAQAVPVRNLDRRPPRDAAQSPQWQRCDLLELAALKDAIRRFSPTHVFHLAARTDLRGSRLADYADNTDAVRNLIAAIGVQPSVQRVIFLSTQMVNPHGYRPAGAEDLNPTTPYGASKAEGERIVRSVAADAPFAWTIVRPTTIWGPWFEAPFHEFFDSVRRGLYVHPRGRRILKMYGYVGNSVTQLDCLLRADAAVVDRKLFYLCDYEPLEVGEWADLIRRAEGKSAVPRVPLVLLRLAARAGDALLAVGAKHAPLTSFRLNNMLAEIIQDTGELRAICGDLPFGVPEGVAHTLAWMQAREAARA